MSGVASDIRKAFGVAELLPHVLQLVAPAALSSDVARRTGAKVVSVDYRLAPERPFPAALQDASAAYRGLLDSGVNPRDVAMVGDSAGGGMSPRRSPRWPTRGFPSRRPPCSSRRGRTSRSAGRA